MVTSDNARLIHGSPATITMTVEPAVDAAASRRHRVGRPPIEESIEFLMPSQFHAPANESWWPGEKRLMLAVLRDAIDILSRGPGVNGPRRRHLFEETVGWFASDDVEWPFSFVNVCDGLGVDSRAIRGAVRRRAKATRRAPEAAR